MSFHFPQSKSAIKIFQPEHIDKLYHLVIVKHELVMCLQNMLNSHDNSLNELSNFEHGLLIIISYRDSGETYNRWTSILSAAGSRGVNVLTIGVEIAISGNEKLGDNYNVTNLDNLQQELDIPIFCEIVPNPCFNNKCGHGICNASLTSGEYSCDCNLPYTGPYCNEAPDFCEPVSNIHVIKMVQ